MITFDNVSYGYSKNAPKIFENLSFNVEQGTFTALLGPSGAGKSTILWHIMGELHPQQGSVTCMGANPGLLSARRLMLYRRKVGYVPQDLLLLEHHTVYANVNSILRGIGLSRKESNTRTRNVLDMVGLADRHKSLPNELSGGERQRLAIARALSVMPQVLLADEPTGNLDPARSEEIMQLFKNIYEMGITVLIATHEQQLMEKLGADTLYIERNKPPVHTVRTNRKEGGANEAGV